jgi:exopolysaccharide production protein ExoQ
MKAFLRFAEKFFTVTALLLFSKAVLGVVRSGASSVSSAEGDSFLQVIWFGIYAITFCLLAVQWRGFTRIPKNIIKPILLLTGVALFSFFWSDVPSVTLRRSIALVGTTLFGIYFATRYSPKEQLRLLAWALGTAAVLSLVFAVALPGYGIDVYPFAGAWRGVYSQKNLLGRFMSMSALIFLLVALSTRKHRWIPWSIFGLSTALILLSTSKTALIIFATLLILLPFYKALRWQYSVSIPIFIMAILAFAGFAIWFTTEAETVLGYFGKDITLTGRTELWYIVFKMIQQHPWLGYGYSGFWLGARGPSGYIWDVIGWPAPHAHNGFLDLWLDLGIIGLLAFIVSFVMTLGQAIAYIRQTKTWEAFWPITFLTAFFLLNLAQSTIVAQNDLIWIIYVSLNFLKPL